MIFFFLIFVYLTALVLVGHVGSLFQAVGSLVEAFELLVEAYET